MTRRTALVIAAAVVVAAASGVGVYLWADRPAAGPPPPSLPTEWTDPSIREIAEQKRKSVLAAPHSGPAWGELAMAFDANEASPEAMTCYRRAMALAPDDARWPFLLAEQLNWRSKTEINKEEALRLYRRAADCPPISPAHRAATLLSLADMLTELGRADEAAPIYQRVHDADPADPWAAYKVGTALADRGEVEKASRILLGLARNPFARKKSAAAMAELSRLAGKTKDAEGYDYAAGLLPEDLLRVNPYAAEVAELRRGRVVLVDTLVAQEKAQDHRAAVRTANTLADQYPAPQTQLFLLRALVNAGDYPAALAAADDLLRTEDGKQQVTAHTLLGMARIGLADRAEAEGRKTDADRWLAQAAESLAVAVRLKPDYVPGQLYLARTQLRLGRLPDAEKAARAGIAFRPEEWEAYLTLADVLAAVGRKPEAVAAVEQAVKLAPPNEPRPKQALEALKK